MASSSTASTSGRRGQSSFQDRKMQRRENKRPRKPTDIVHALMDCVLNVCKPILFVDTSVKVCVYLLGVAIGSVLCDQFEVPKSYFSDKKNVLNLYFVKLGWGWTLTLVAPYVALSSWVFCCGRLAALRRHLMRLVVATVQWYVCVRTFRYIENATGICTDSEHTDHYACVKSGETWLGFDISGHVFLLLHSLLTITEEMKTFQDWHELECLLRDRDLQSKRNVTLTAKDISKTQKYHRALTPYIKVVFVTVALLTVLWDFMMLTSVLYRFHTVQQKVTASVVAVACWFLSYKVFYKSDVKWLPCQPGKTVLYS